MTIHGPDRSGTWVFMGRGGVEKGRACDRRVIAACLGTGCPSLRNEPNEERKRTAIRLTAGQGDAEKQEKQEKSRKPVQCAIMGGANANAIRLRCIALHCLHWGADSEAPPRISNANGE